MFISKLRAGLLCLDTADGKRYVRPTLLQRLQLTWVFRNFKIIPLNVLSRNEAGMVEYLRLHGPYVQLRQQEFEIPLLGTIEYPQHTEKRPPKEPSHRLAEVVSFAPRNLAPQRATGISPRQGNRR